LTRAPELCDYIRISRNRSWRNHGEGLVAPASLDGRRRCDLRCRCEGDTVIRVSMPLVTQLVICAVCLVTGFVVGRLR